ncbi:MAG: TetR/AcrR family transcriptional regulator [Desulfonatronovibrionaceae bacterium]
MTQKQKEKSRQTRQELMEAAYSLFKENGYLDTSVAEITARAGYAKGNFYRHWKSKDELFLDIMAERLRHYRALREPALAKARNIEDVVHVVISFLETMVDDQGWYKVFLEFTVHSFGDPEIKKRLNQSTYRLSTGLFAELFAPFVPDRQGTEKLGALVTALFEGFLIHQALETRVLDKEDLREALMVLSRSFLPGLGKETGKDHKQSTARGKT